MSFRLEKKLYIKKENFFEFKNYLLKNKLKQLYEARKVKSLYFDNLEHRMYHDSIEGLTPRKKIRIRTYPFSDNKDFFLEYKISSIEGRYKKNKKISEKEYEISLKNGFFDSNYGVCKPILNVIYDREYFIQGDVRLTFDTNIKYSLFDKNYISEDPNIIVELKSSIDKSIDDLFKQFPFQEIRFSKYCNGLQMLKRLS
tara:strand:+ start:257 stop:853 length:597 start_codon:yes stop_codon:yes gene_type:complete